jgi:hypothetical protein
MTLVNFPSPATPGQTYTVNEVTYTYDGVKWSAATVDQFVHKSGDTMSGNLTVPSINGGPLAGMRNRILNGAMTVAQRGTSFPALTNPGSTNILDRWVWAQNGTMVCAASLSTDAPNDTFRSSLKIDVTTADTSIIAGDYTIITQRIEGVNVRDLAGTTFTLSFWVKSPKVGVHCVSFRNGQTVDRSYVKEYTVTTANTWEYKTITVTGGLITAGTWDWNNGAGLDVGFTLLSGTTFQTTANAWQTGNFVATASQVNVMDNAANDFFLTGVQLETGPVATPFERRPIGTELALCQRYFYAGSYDNETHFALGAAEVSCFINVILPVPMRAVPTIATKAQAYSNVAGPPAYKNQRSGNFTAYWVYTNGGVVVSRAISADYLASAEL